MHEKIKQWHQQFDQLSFREKLMIVVAALLTFWGSWDALYYESAHKKRHALAAEIAALDSQQNTWQQVIRQYEDANGHDPNQAKRDNLIFLQQSINELKQRISLGRKRFVPSELMAGALRDMLKQHGNIRLIELQTLPPEPFGNGEHQPVWVYRHAMNLTLQGDYLSTLSYLQALEVLPWRIHWDSIGYQVKDYPLAEIRIQVYTLSFEQDWLGV